jgi:hypothetical protein
MAQSENLQDNHILIKLGNLPPKSMLKYEGRTKMSIIFIGNKNNFELYLEKNIWTVFSIISVLIRFLAPEK